MFCNSLKSIIIPMRLRRSYAGRIVIFLFQDKVVMVIKKNDIFISMVGTFSWAKSLELNHIIS